MKNRLAELLPDTLHVSPEEPGVSAIELNNHLQRASDVQYINNLNDNNYFDLAMLADLEQGWSVPEKVRMSVKSCIDNGINVIHIEDQGVKKRCGHLGDKELATIEDYEMILKAANLAAQEKLGSDQAREQWVTFVARTDALSAKRMTYSSNLENKDHPEHKFIDWERGSTSDGKYLYIKQGTNPETNRPWGLDLSIERATHVVKLGLASHVWMETPNADLSVAKEFMDTVNENLKPFGRKAFGLYNHSPSFDWDVKFYEDAQPLTELISDFVKNTIYPNFNTEYIDDYVNQVYNFFVDFGDKIKGDQHFTREACKEILYHAMDHAKGQDTWKENLNSPYRPTTYLEYSIQKQKDELLLQGFNSKQEISNIIVEQRLIQFEPMLARYGFNLHLITLPEFHVIAHNMHNLSKQFDKEGINAFVQLVQRPERIKSTIDPSYTYYKHQTATGTGVEAAFNGALGSSDVNILADSTEADDIKKRSV